MATDKELDAYYKVKQEKKQKNREERKIKETDEYMETVCSNVSNLSSAFNSLSEIDEKLLGDPEEVIQMKNQIFDALKYYCGHLPRIE